MFTGCTTGVHVAASYALCACSGGLARSVSVRALIAADGACVALILTSRAACTRRTLSTGGVIARSARCALRLSWGGIVHALRALGTAQRSSRRESPGRTDGASTRLVRICELTSRATKAPSRACGGAFAMGTLGAALRSFGTGVLAGGALRARRRPLRGRVVALLARGTGASTVLATGVTSRTFHAIGLSSGWLVSTWGATGTSIRLGCRVPTRRTGIATVIGRGAIVACLAISARRCPGR